MKVNHLSIAVSFFLGFQSIQPSPADPSAPQTTKKTASGKTAGVNTPASAKSKLMVGKQMPAKAAANNASTAKPIPASPLKTASGAQNPLVLQGHIKHHKHPLRSLLKEEFDSPIHPITTDNKDF
jgi:hypothetical protein